MERAGLHKLIWIGILISMGIASPCLQAQRLDETKAIKVKAAYLYSFSKFVTWPGNKFETDQSPIILGLLGEEAHEMKALLDTVNEDKGLIQNRPFEVVILKYVPPTAGGPLVDHEELDQREQFIKQIRACHLLFVDRSSKKMRSDIFSLIDEYRVLSVGGGDGFVRGGGMVALVRKGESIVFQVNVASVNEEDLVISPKLLRRAELIR